MQPDSLAPYDYEFPKSAIAQQPAHPRDSAKLLIYNRADGTVIHDTFKNLARHLPKNALLVFNETKVIPARLTLTKPTGGAVRILYLATEKNGIRVLADRPLVVGQLLTLTKRISFIVAKHEGKEYLLEPNIPKSHIQNILDRYGVAPIPPYIKETPLTQKELRKQYQTVFAEKRGSIAAPTASLHFTKGLLQKLRRAHIATAFVTLHVGLGTFAPLTEEHLRTGSLHHEHYEIPPKTITAINRAKQEGRPVIAVGTTVVRTLESAFRTTPVTRTGETTLFIREGYHYKIVDGMITNFHVPKSSLLMLVSALVGREKILELYRTALRNNYRFFSFGDGMLLL